MLRLSASGIAPHCYGTVVLRMPRDRGPGWHASFRSYRRAELAARVNSRQLQHFSASVYPIDHYLGTLRMRIDVPKAPNSI